MTLQDVEHRMEAVELLSSSHSTPWQGFISLHGSKHRTGKCGQQWGGERCGTWHPTAHIAAAAKVHSEVGVFGLGTRFCGFSRQEHNLQGVLGGSKQLHMLPPLQALAHPAETWGMAASISSKLLEHLPRAGFAEATQHPLRPSPHPGTCRPAPTRGLLLLPAALSLLPAGVSCPTTPTGHPQWGPQALTCSGDP